MKKQQENQSTAVVVVLVLSMGKPKLHEEELDPEEGILQRDTSRPDRMLNHSEEMQKKDYVHVVLILFLLFQRMIYKSLSKVIFIYAVLL